MSVGDPLLQTKLAPPSHSQTLPRERLLARAHDAAGTRLLLISAPAGSGKTAFLTTWLQSQAQQGALAAWLTLDERDNDPAGFAAYLVAALARAGAPIDALAGGDANVEATLTRLINALAAHDRECALVLDDYQAISATAVHDAVAFLLDHLPERVCVAIGSRSDPPLPLARLRAGAQLVELRADDLRFTADEIQSFFRCAGGPALTRSEAQMVEAYLEGWAAGVQMVAHALRADLRGPPVRDLPARLEECRRDLFAYLADEVFERQPAHIKTFLLQTAILDRMCGPLCDAVLGLSADERPCAGAAETPDLPLDQCDSYTGRILEQLEQANIFVTPLDAERRWVRYQRLFRAFLRARLDHEPPGAVAELHRRAGAWFERSHALLDAAEHALAVGDLARAAALIECSECTPRRCKLSEADHLRARMARLRQEDPQIVGAAGSACHACMAESLSERELEVLHLVGDGASNQAIAATLVVSIGTVKSHVNHILGKLDAENRTEAVARARSLGIL